MTSSKVRSGSKLIPLDPASVAEGALSAWFSLTHPSATITGAGYSSVPDRLDGSNPAVQSVDARRPVNQTAANGLPIMTWNSGNQNLTSPLTTSRNGATYWGCAAWVRMTSLAAATQTIVSILNATGNASADKTIAYVSTNEFRINVYTSNVVGRRSETPAASAVVSTWQFLTFEFDSTGASEATRSAISINGVAQTLDFSSIGAGTVPTSLVVPTGDLLIGAGANGGVATLQFGGSMGPNVYLLGSKMAGAGVGLLTPAARVALMNYERPT